MCGEALKNLGDRWVPFNVWQNYMNGDKWKQENVDVLKEW